MDEDVILEKLDEIKEEVKTELRDQIEEIKVEMRDEFKSMRSELKDTFGSRDRQTRNPNQSLNQELLPSLIDLDCLEIPRVQDQFIAKAQDR